MLRGYDIDGVITAGIKPEKPCILITARSLASWDETIREIGTEIPIFLSPYGEPGYNRNTAKWKAQVINLLGVAEFYEDSTAQADYLRVNCPDCTVRLVKNGRVVLWQ